MKGARKLRIGSGSAWWGDRVDPARWNAERGKLNYLCFETMAEATISAAQVRRRRDPSFKGFDTYFDERMRAVLPGCLRNNTRIISNQGWLNPAGAAERMVELLREHGASGRKVASVDGSIVTDRLFDIGGSILETGGDISMLKGQVISAEAYQGAGGIVEALKQGADFVFTGRVADPSLFLAPMIYEFRWDPADVLLMARGSAIGHLMECGAQVTGGYFCDPGLKDVPEPWNLAFPIAELEIDGDAVLSKVSGTGGAINAMTVKEQMLYEVHDPAAYLTPDATVDFTTVRIEELPGDRVRISGVSGHPRPSMLKVSIGCEEGFLGEDMFFYAGVGAVRRAELAKRILIERFKIVQLDAEELRIDLLGLNAIHGTATPADAPEPYEVGVRVAARTKTHAEAVKVGREVDAMAVSGVGMTGKRVPFQERTREIVGVWSTLVPREAVQSSVSVITS